MCAPAILPLVFSVGQFAIGATSSVLGYMGQQQQADQQAQYQANLSMLEQERAQREQLQLQRQYSQEMFSRQVQIGQEKEASAREMMGLAKEARAVRSKIKVASGEAGVRGTSIDGLLNEVTRQELGYLEAKTRQLQLMDQNFMLNAMNMEESLRTNSSNALFGSQMRLANINRPIERPSLWALGTNLFGQGLSSANSYYSNKYYQRYGAGSGQTTDLVSGIFGV
jgi:hypothetical protein